MGCTTGTGRGKAHLSIPLLGKINQLLDTIYRKIRVDSEDERKLCHNAQRHEVFEEVIRRLRVEVWSDSVRRDRTLKHRITICGCFRDKRGCNCAARSSFVFNQDGLSDLLGERFTNCARDKIRSTARRNGHYHRNRLVWIAGLAVCREACEGEGEC